MSDANAFPSFTDAAADLLAAGYALRFRATGRSMSPSLDDGDLLTVERIAIAEIKIGDVILYRARKGVIAHRVAKIEKELDCISYLSLRGDASEDCDEPVSPEQVLGKVTAVTRNGCSIAVAGRTGRLLRAFRACASRLRILLALPSSRVNGDRSSN